MPKPYTPNDKWSRKAASEGFRARSVYKLQELDERYHLFGPGMKVMDIGAAPGSWLQYSEKAAGPGGKIVGIDLKPIESLGPQVITVICDIFDPEALEQALEKAGLSRFDLILSDLAPNTSGIKDVDQWRSLELNRQVLKIAALHLGPKGTVVLKVFRGRDFDVFIKELKGRFRILKVASVRASRDRSREVYLVCRDVLRK